MAGILFLPDFPRGSPTHCQWGLQSLMTVLLFSRSVCLTLWDLMDPCQAWLLCPSVSPRVCSNSCPLSQWCQPTISSSAINLLFLPSVFPSIRHSSFTDKAGNLPFLTRYTHRNSPVNPNVIDSGKRNCEKPSLLEGVGAKGGGKEESRIKVKFEPREKPLYHIHPVEFIHLGDATWDRPPNPSTQEFGRGWCCLAVVQKMPRSLHLPPHTRIRRGRMPNKHGSLP